MGRGLGVRERPQAILVDVDGPLITTGGPGRGAGGDSVEEPLRAHVADAIAVGLAGGRYSEAELREAGADHVLGSLVEALPGTVAESP